MFFIGKVLWRYCCIRFLSGIFVVFVYFRLVSEYLDLEVEVLDY